MDGIVYTPGAGHSPPMLAGREDLVSEWQLTLNGLVAQGRVAAQDMLLTGPRGVGKTSMLTAYGAAAREQGFEVVHLQAARHHVSLVEALAAQARSWLEDGEGVWRKAQDALMRLTGLSVGVAGVSVGINATSAEERIPGPVQDPGELARALGAVANAIHREHDSGGLLVTVDELQAAHPSDLTLIAAALHRLNVDHLASPVAFAASGLPHTIDVLTDAGVTHPDRLFVLEQIPLTLTPRQTELAIALPAQQRGVTWHPQALDAVVAASNGYPAHVQLIAHEIWRYAPGPSLITPDDAQAGVGRAAGQISRRTLGPRWDRMPDRQMEYMAALALNGGTATTRRLEATLGRESRASAMVRQKLIEQGDIYAPRRGQVRMSMPVFVPFVLARYEEAREESETRQILSLDQMRANINADPRPHPQETRMSSGERKERHVPPPGPQASGPRP